MPSTGLIIADSSPLIGLARIGHLTLVKSLAGRVWVPPAVWDEITQFDRPEARVLSAQTWIEVVAPRAADVIPFSSMLDKGEAEALALAINQSGAALLIDDLRGRRVAARLNIRHFGTVGLLGQAKREGLVSAVRPLLEALVANGIYLGQELTERALRQLGE